MADPYRDTASGPAVVFVVITGETTWLTTSRRIVAVFDNENAAVKLSERLRMVKNGAWEKVTGQCAWQNGNHRVGWERHEVQP